MKCTVSYIAHNGIRIFLMGFWLYVAMDKLWKLSSFCISLEQQPLLRDFAPVLSCLIPILELGIALQFALNSEQKKTCRNLCFLSPFLLSALLIGVFTLYIGLGVAGIYARKPCMCSSFLQGISWAKHLLVNMALLALSLLGYWLARDIPKRAVKYPSCRRSVLLQPAVYLLPGSVHSGRRGSKTNAIDYRRRFAVFGRCTVRGTTG